MEEDSASGDERTLPAGAPTRVSEWLVPPTLFVALAALEVFGPSTTDGHHVAAVPVIGAVLLVAAAVGLWIFGYQAYRDLTQKAVDRYLTAAVISLLVAAVVLLFSFSFGAFVPLAWAGYVFGSMHNAWSRKARALLPARLWQRVAIVAAAVTVAATLLTPLAVGLDYLPLIVLATVGRTVVAFVFGFALRARSSAAHP